MKLTCPKEELFTFYCDHLMHFCSCFDVTPSGNYSESLLRVMQRDLEDRWRDLKTSYRDVMLVPEGERYPNLRITARLNYQAYAEVYFQYSAKILDLIKSSSCVSQTLGFKTTVRYPLATQDVAQTVDSCSSNNDTETHPSNKKLAIEETNSLTQDESPTSNESHTITEEPSSIPEIIHPTDRKHKCSRKFNEITKLMTCSIARAVEDENSAINRLEDQTSEFQKYVMNYRTQCTQYAIEVILIKVSKVRYSLRAGIIHKVMKTEFIGPRRIPPWVVFDRGKINVLTEDLPPLARPKIRDQQVVNNI